MASLLKAKLKRDSRQEMDVYLKICHSTESVEFLDSVWVCNNSTRFRKIKAKKVQIEIIINFS